MHFSRLFWFLLANFAASLGERPGALHQRLARGDVPDPFTVPSRGAPAGTGAPRRRWPLVKSSFSRGASRSAMCSTAHPCLLEHARRHAREPGRREIFLTRRLERLVPETDRRAPQPELDVQRAALLGDGAHELLLCRRELLTERPLRTSPPPWRHRVSCSVPAGSVWMHLKSPLRQLSSSFSLVDASFPPAFLIAF